MKITSGLYNKLQQRDCIKRKRLQSLGALCHSPEVTIDRSYWEQKHRYISLERNVMAVMITRALRCRSQPVLSFPAELTEMYDQPYIVVLVC